MSQEPCCDYDEFIKAMADETRQNILALVQERERDVSEIGQHFPLTQPTISHHLAILKRANLVLFRREGKHTYYSQSGVCSRMLSGDFRSS